MLWASEQGGTHSSDLRKDSLTPQFKVIIRRGCSDLTSGWGSSPCKGPDSEEIFAEPERILLSLENSESDEGEREDRSCRAVWTLVRILSDILLVNGNHCRLWTGSDIPIRLCQLCVEWIRNGYQLVACGFSSGERLWLPRTGDDSENSDPQMWIRKWQDLVMVMGMKVSDGEKTRVSPRSWVWASVYRDGED